MALASRQSIGPPDDDLGPRVSGRARLHPHTGSTVVLLGAVDGDDVGMAQAGEQSALLNGSSSLSGRSCSSLRATSRSSLVSQAR